MPLYSQCSICKHFSGYKGNKRTCKAFPEGIPEVFLAYSFEPEEDIQFIKEKYDFNMKSHAEIFPGQAGNYVFEKAPAF